MLVRPIVKTVSFKLDTGTLHVKTRLEEKAFFAPWGGHCFLRRKPETIEPVFIDSWDAMMLWDVLQRTIKKDLRLTSHGIHFLAIESTLEPYDLFVVLGLMPCGGPGWLRYSRI